LTKCKLLNRSLKFSSFTQIFQQLKVKKSGCLWRECKYFSFTQIFQQLKVKKREEGS